MKEKIQDLGPTIEIMKEYAKAFIKWVLISSVTGVICGFVGTAFHSAIGFATDTRSAHPWILFLLPVAGLIINFIYQSQHMEKDADTNLVIKSIRAEGAIPFKLTYSIFIGTILTHLFGGSAGREGAALQIGGGIGAAVGRKMKLNERDLRLITMCGMSAVFSALFSTPITATIFSIEVITVGLFQYSALVPCLMAAVIATGVAGLFHGEGTSYTIAEYPVLNPTSFVKVMILGILCALLSMLFCKIMHFTAHKLGELIKNRYLRVFAGGCIIIGLTLLVGNQDYNGAGSDIIDQAIAGNVAWYAFLLKMLFTAITLGSGYKGGEIVPTFFIGATFGCVVGPLIGLPASFSAAICMVGMFCGVVNCPISSILLGIELFSSQSLILFAAVCAISYMMSGSSGLYTGQKIAYSKIEPKFIDRNVH